MGTPIRSYTEMKCVFGGDDSLYPGQPALGIMQVFYEGDVPQMVDFLCPCGCGHTVPTHVVSLEEKQQGKAGDKDHRWGFDPKTLTLVPSIRFTSGCKAHFNITNGQVIVHADSGK